MSLRDALRDLMAGDIRVLGRRVRLPEDTVVLDEHSVGGLRVTRTCHLDDVQKAIDGGYGRDAGYEKYLVRWENEGRLRR